MFSNPHGHSGVLQEERIPLKSAKSLSPKTKIKNLRKQSICLEAATLARFLAKEPLAPLGGDHVPPACEPFFRTLESRILETIQKKNYMDSRTSVLVGARAATA